MKQIARKFPATYFNTMSKHLHLSKRNSRKLRYPLKQFNICSSDIINDYIDTRSDYLKPYFSIGKGFVFCNNISNLVLVLNEMCAHQVFFIKLIIFFSHYHTFLKDWVLFIDASKLSLKAVLMHKKKVFPQFQLRAFACMTTLTRIGIKCRNERQEIKMSLV